MATTSKPQRHAKGVNLIDLVKTLRVIKRQRPLEGLSPEAEALLNERVLSNQWYAFDLFKELLIVMFREALASNEEYALRVGIAGGHMTLTTIHRAFIKEGDPISSLLSMRHIWQSYFDFGTHKVEQVNDRSVRFILTDYPDMPAVHGMMIIGWDIAAAEAAGAQNVKHEILEKPWQGDSRFEYLVSI